MAVTTQPQSRQLFSTENLLAGATRSHARASALLVIVSLLAFLPGLFQIPAVDRDEARFAQATKQMLETGNYIDIRFQDEARYKKPVGIYWLQAAAVKAGEAVGISHARSRIWLYRLPSLAGALGAVLLTYWAGLALSSRRASLVGGMLLASSILLGVEARLAKTDAMLLLTVVAAMGALARVYAHARGKKLEGHPLAVAAVFWAALAAGVLLKGPLIFLLVGLPAAVLSLIDRSGRWLLALRPGLGIPLFCVLVLPWYVSIMTVAGNSFLQESVGRDLLPKIFSGQEGHGAPPGTYLVLFLVTFWPLSALAGVAAPAIFSARRELGAKFMLAWALPSWILFEIVVTKLPHYVLPLYPAIALLVADALDRRLLPRHVWLERGTLWWFVFPAALAVIGIALQIALAGSPGLLSWPLFAAAVVFGLFAWWLYRLDGAERSLLRAIAASVLSSLAMFGAAVPNIPNLFPAVDIAAYVRRAGCERPLLAAAGYHEPSLVFLAGTGTVLTDGQGSAEFLNGGPCRFAAVEKRQERSFVQRADLIGLRYAPSSRIEGFNFSAGRSVSMVIYRSEGTPAPP